jgi:hypothetical protein
MASVSGTEARPWFTAKVQGVAAVAAGTDGLEAGTIQAALQDLATRVQALEDA